MNVAEMIAVIQAYGFDDVDDTAGLQLLNDAQYYLAKKLKGAPILEKTATWATDANQNTMAAQPADLGQIKTLIDLNNKNKLQPTRRDTFLERYVSSLDEKGDAYWYYIYGGK